MKRFGWVLVIGLLLASLVVPAMATTTTSTGLFEAPSGTSIVINNSYVPGASAFSRYINGFTIGATENWTGFSTLYGYLFCLNTALTDSNSTPVSIYSGDTVVGAGTFSYSKSSANYYYVSLILSSWTPGSLSGTQRFNFTTPDLAQNWNLGKLEGFWCYDKTYGINEAYFSAPETIDTCYNDYTLSVISGDFSNTWSVENTPPFTNISVLKLQGGIYYPSAVYIKKGSSLLAYNATLTGDTFRAILTSEPYIQINVTDRFGRWYQSPIVYAGGVSPVYTISVLPENITTNSYAAGGISSVTDPWLNGVIGISWLWSDTEGSHLFYDTGNMSRPLDYILDGGTWYGYDDTIDVYKINKGTSVPNPVILSGITSTGDKTVICNVYTSDGNYYTLTADLFVGGSTSESSGRVLVEAADWRTDDLIPGAEINIKNLGSGLWSNLTTDIGSREYFAPVGSRLYVEAYKSGYDRNANSMYQIRGQHDFITITMFPTGSGSATVDNTTLYVTSYDYDTRSKRTGVSIRVVDDGQFKITPDSGTVSFTVKNGSAYTVSASCSANQCYSGTKTETVSGASYVMQFFLASVKAATPTPTLAPGVTASPTPVPTLDTRTNAEKSGEMVDFIYSNGYTLVVLFFLATLFGIMSMMGKK